MTTQFQPPPTYANPVVVDEVTKKSQFSPIWLKWFLDIAAFISASGGGGGGGVSVAHNSLTGLQGGGTGEEYHFTATEHSALSAGFTGTGNIVRAGSPALATPDLGTPSALVATHATGTASGLTAGNVTTNANLTGPITSVGNATTIANGIGATVTTGGLVGKTMTFTNGVLTGYA